MRHWVVKTCVLAASVLSLSAAPVGAQGTCAAPANLVPGQFSFQDQAVFDCFQEAIAEFIRDVAKYNNVFFTTPTGDRLSFLANPGVRTCLTNDALRAQALHQAGNAAAACDILADMRARLLEVGGAGSASILNNCFIRLTCGFTSQGFLLRCNEAQRRAATTELADDLACAIALCNDRTCETAGAEFPFGTVTAGSATLDSGAGSGSGGNAAGPGDSRVTLGGDDARAHGKIDAQGNIDVPGGKATFALSVVIGTEGIISGNLVWQDHAARIRIKDISILSAQISGTQGTVTGTASLDGGGEVAFSMTVNDLGEPGAGSDTISFSIPSLGYGVGGTIDGGNVQIHF